MMGSLEEQLKLRTDELFDVPAVRLILVLNPAERALVLRLVSPRLRLATADCPDESEMEKIDGDRTAPFEQVQRAHELLPSSSLVEQYASLIGGAAEMLEHNSTPESHEWETVRFTTKEWDIVAYRTPCGVPRDILMAADSERTPLKSTPDGNGAENNSPEEERGEHRDTGSYALITFVKRGE